MVEELDDRLYGNAITDTQQALAGLVDRTRDYGQALVNERVPTRLGDGSVDVEIDGKLSSPFTGATIDTLSIRGNWLRNAQPGSKAKVSYSQRRAYNAGRRWRSFRIRRGGTTSSLICLTSSLAW